MRCLVLAMSAATIATGCSGHSVSPPPMPTATYSSAEKLCRDTFAGRSVLGWMTTDVADLRAYQFGGPVPHRPLHGAFAGIRATQAAAWCVLEEGPQSSSLWGVVAGSHPVRAITMTGPGEGTFRGEIRHPPALP